MSKPSNIRWKQSDYDELNRAVKNFNAKIARLEKKYPEIKNALPERVQARELKNLIKTRNDLNRELNSLRRFTDRKNVIARREDGSFEGIVPVPGNKYNLEFTSWQKKEMGYRLGVINRKRKERYEFLSEMQATSRGEPLGYTVGDVGMGSVDANAVKPMKAYFPTMNRRDLNKRFKGMRVERMENFWTEKEMRLKANVMKGIEANYHALFPEETEAILNSIEKMDFQEFYIKFHSEQGEMEFISPKPGQTMDSQLRLSIEALQSTWVPNYKK